MCEKRIVEGFLLFNIYRLFANVYKYFESELSLLPLMKLCINPITKKNAVITITNLIRFI